ncbi:winged helix-turn-helix domain-containing protein [Desulforhopalus sp. IMCC35007]|uniref:winged helix-turn-helix domain-containing protein n=1 Tax=Desulforhopalus sp. IMCC35007 TaxID=2569543 RepID=UPI0010AE8C4A|nr:crosslink repair DNA glycosylase YcaQ family protein [Desulforhopalus sp. IMCC35007]TKB08420.1 winged helix-turn-helix domain-containing protein [Desulforhopalus sp. IMCC35007]
MKESLSIQQARKLVLLSQRIPPKNQAGSATAATLSAIEHLGYIQIDTISVIQRAHHHTLWSRNPRYKAAHLDQLLLDKLIFEYWSHAAAYLPLRDYRFSLPRKHALASGEQSHWYDRDEQMMKFVLNRIAAEGPLMAKDFEYTGKKIGEWKTKPAKRALEYLFMQGELMVPYRVKFHKVYDLTERVLPEGTDTTLPDPEEYARFLIIRYLRANGLGQSAEVAYLLYGTRPLVSATLEDMVSTGELRQVRAAGEIYYTLPASLELLNKPLARSKLKILSPFDNLVIQRRRMKALFGFDYLIECYVPRSRRRYGYFSLPILWDGKLVARMDCRAERNESLLHIHHLALEPTVLKTDALFLALRKELEAFLQFNHCNKLRVYRTSPAKVKPELQILINDLTR